MGSSLRHQIANLTQLAAECYDNHQALLGDRLWVVINALSEIADAEEGRVATDD